MVVSWPPAPHWVLQKEVSSLALISSKFQPNPTPESGTLIPRSITMWYRRHECGLRMAIFFSMATAAGAFGGLLARGISEMDGVGGKGGWAWIFILEGIVTFLVALWAYWAFNDYPDTAKFISDLERKEIYRRLDDDRSSLADEFNVKFV